MVAAVWLPTVLRETVLPTDTASMTCITENGNSAVVVVDATILARDHTL